MSAGEWPPRRGLRGLQPAGPASGPCPALPGRVPGGLRIGVLGTVTVNAAPAARWPAQASLLLALALNPDSVAGDQLRYLLGDDPDHPKSGAAVRQLITRSRCRLGRAPGGAEWIEHAGGGTYLLHPAARVDWTEFAEFAGHGTGAACVPCLRHALGLVRGEPFAGCPCWWLSPGTSEAARADIVTAALNLAGLELAEDPAASARAARTGLRADRASEPLWRALMRAQHAGGHRAGVHEAYARCLEEIADVAPGGQPHPDTAALYRQLTHGRAEAG